ncbi:hypothetical protein Q5762_07390 [Streptomyces sp. P9(2023)]|uniref:hypothetical protein n=1 Tax=Streptomyces sp. P9(2023) TaxID=3064394 RepID=UPI0028F44339|nr:hypothetical protein [Streptomyces sp. P9(2023)]MDT9688180.1 hypothetical protein [Streptomyces sp. P9(2023)]
MTTPEEVVEEAAEQPSRLAGGCVLVAGVAAAGAVAYAVPETGYYAAGLLTAAGIRRARTWAAGRRRTDEESDEEQPVDIVTVLQELGEGGQHVRLTQLQEAAGLPGTKAVRALLDEADIPVRTGVRAGGKNGPGVHHDDIPPVEALCEPSCLCRSDANTNANNDGEGAPREGFRVEHTGQAGVTVYDLSETHRHSPVTR